ncbi:SAM-dependent methyltransferase [Corynebacterium kutscheri]|uniref:SAM-dependent methyltransferase n=2 Tax=Corynebacterium kutscheri TaxID=35755 RepID=A0AB38VSJ8_9CORY|nr:SAM-dependent methyltransferase [Corynebacterium kutscheri]VEH79516.1 SAM-dependent methyltransferase [Corynebacterium kutscheri]
MSISSPPPHLPPIFSSKKINNKKLNDDTSLTRPTDLAIAATTANKHWWDSDANDYHHRHSAYLSSFYWCPEMLHEKDAGLLGSIDNQKILEVGCGSAPCSHWLASRYPDAQVTAFDISAQMLRRYGETSDTKSTHSPPNLHLLQANALALPFAEKSFDIVFSAFGAFPFLPDLTAAFTEVAAVIKPGGLFVYSIGHPMRWIFDDDPASMQVRYSYFDKDYEEHDEYGQLSYAEYQHQFSEHIRALSATGFSLYDVHEPAWPADLTQTWGQWSPLRGAHFPGTAIFSARYKSLQTGT